MCVFHVTRISKNGMTTAVIWTDRKNWWLEQDQGKIVSSFSGDGAYYSHTYLEFGSRLIVCIECIFTTKCVEWYTNWPLCIDLDAHSANFLLQHFRIRNFRPKLKSRLTFLWRWSHFRKLKKDSNFLWNKVLQKRNNIEGQDSYVRTIHKSYWLARFWLDEDLFLRVHSKYPLCRLDFIWWYAIKVITYAGFRCNGGWSYRTLKPFVIITNTHLNAD